jgi:hypothetical protein
MPPVVSVKDDNVKRPVSGRCRKHACTAKAYKEAEAVESVHHLELRRLDRKTYDTEIVFDINYV